jgi:hypothetical protein
MVPASKYRNRKTVVDGFTFDSKLEAERYRELCVLQRTDVVRLFLRQVPFDLAPGVRYRLDFLVIWNRPGTSDVGITYEDTKGHMTATSRVKIKTVEHLFGIRIAVLTRADVGR